LELLLFKVIVSVDFVIAVAVVVEIAEVVLMPVL